jgi:hypothetical protein
MLDFTLEDISSEDVARLRALYEPLAQSVRELIDVTIRTQVDADVLAAAKSEIDSATARLRRKQLDGTFGVRYLTSGERMAWGNAVIGIRNPIAPPVEIHTTTQASPGAIFTWVRPTKARPGTCTAASPRWFSITCWERLPAMA